MLKVKLNTDILQSVRLLLEESNLPLHDIDDYIEKRQQQQGTPDRPIDWIQSHYFAATGKQYPFTDVWEEISKLKPVITLQYVCYYMVTVLYVCYYMVTVLYVQYCMYVIIWLQYCIYVIIWLQYCVYCIVS